MNYLIVFKLFSFNKCNIIDRKGNKTQQTEIIVGPVNGLEPKSLLLLTRLLNDMVDDFLCVLVLNPIIEQSNINAKIECAKIVEKFQTQATKRTWTKNKTKGWVSIQMQVDSSSMSLSSE